MIVRASENTFLNRTSRRPPCEEEEDHEAAGHREAAAIGESVDWARGSFTADSR